MADVGWITGHTSVLSYTIELLVSYYASSYIIYGPLANGITTT